METKLITDIFPGVSKEKLKLVIDSLSVEMRTAMYRKYGDDLDKCETILTEQEKFLVKKTIYRLETYFEREKKYYFVDFEEMRRAFPKLQDDNKELLTKVYGKDLKKFNEHQILNFSRMENTMKDVARNSSKDPEKSNKKYPIMEEYYSKYPAKYVDKAISLLTKKDRDMVRRIENGELDLEKNVPFSFTATVTKILSGMIIDYPNYYKDVRDELNLKFTDLSIDTIDKAVDEKLDTRSRNTINKVRNKEELTKRDLINYKAAIRNICTIIKNQKYVETIFALNTSYTKEEVLDAVSKLSEASKKELKLRYGDDLDNPKRSENYTKDNGKVFVEKVLPELEMRLKDARNNVTDVHVKVNPIILKNMKAKEEKVETSTVSKNKTLIELFSEIPSGHLKILVGILPPKHQNILVKRYGINLDTYNYFEGRDYWKLATMHDAAFIFLERAVDAYKKPLELTEKNKENLKDLNDEQLMILKKVHGDKYAYTLPLCVLNESDRKKYTNIRQILDGIKKVKIVKVTPKTVTYKDWSILDKFPGHTIDELREAITYLTDMRKELVYKVYGKNLDEYHRFESQEEYANMYLIRQEISKYFNGDKTILNRKLINRYEGYTLEEIKEQVDMLDIEDKKLVYERHGENLDEYHDKLVSGEYTRLRNVYTKIANRLKKKSKIEITDSTELFKSTMFQKYSVLFNESLTEEEIRYLIDVSVKDYDNDNDRERYIIKHLYNYLKGLIHDNRDILEQIYISKQSRK